MSDHHAEYHASIADILALHMAAILSLAVLVGHPWIGILNAVLSAAVILWRATR